MRRINAVVSLSTVALTAAGVIVTATAADATPVAGRVSGKATKVIVLLADQHRALPATRTGLRARRAAVQADQSPLRSRIGRLGGHTTKAFTTLNAVAATVPSGGVAALRADPAVRAVVPDLPVHMAQPQAVDKPGTGTAAGNSAGAAYCPKNPAKPQLEPEALSLIHADSDKAKAKTARSLGYTGDGVKVGFIADGTDIDQPDLIRADGSHVVVDYQDFSGDGTNSSTSGAEAMGDVSSIAAQGRTSYDISTFVSPAHPLPAGCTIRVEGVAPGSSVVALKVFSNNLLTAPTSTIVQAVDYAINVAHVNVLNESFGSNPYPDNATDPISLANQDAVDAGIAVTASTGDAGTGNTLGTGSTDPNVIAAAATTSERVYAQTGTYGFPLGNGRYTSDQLSGLSSGGISQTNRVPDLAAPGDLNWSLCSDATLADGSPQYAGCANYRGESSNLIVFGGTSESSPLTAGAAALVFQAYRAGHDGQNPSPAQVRTFLTSTTDDLGLPAEEQGTGLLNVYRAVKLAKDFRSSTPSSTEVASSVPQVSNVSPPGPVTNRINLSNQGTRAQKVTASVRQVSQVFASQSQTVPFDPATLPTFLDRAGNVRPYATQTFTVPPGTDRLDAAVSVAGDGSKYVRATLLDPDGTYTAYTLPQGTGNYGHIDVHQPQAGTWTAIIWSNGVTTSFSGPVTLRTSYIHATSAGTVTPSSVTIPPGGTQTFDVTTTVPDTEASAASVVFVHRGGDTTTVPVVNRAVQQVSVGSPATFSGIFDQANGRSFGPAQTFTYLVDVPAGAKDLDVDASVSGTPSNHIIAHLSGPTGEPVSTGRNILTDGSSYSGLQLVHANPQPGRYQLTLELENQSSGAALPQTFTGSFHLNGAQVSADGVPSGATIGAGGATATVHVTNTSATPQTYFVDGRLDSTSTYRLVAGDLVGDAPAAGDPYSRTVSFPLASDDIVPAWLVPTQVSNLTVNAKATRPTTFDLMPLDAPTTVNAPNNPDTEATVHGRTATATHTAPEVASTQWGAFPTVVGPIGPNPATGRVTMQATAVARTFDPAVTSSTGDPLLGTVDANAPAATPVTVAPGASADITVHITPQGPGTVSGTLFVDIAQPFGPKGYSTLTEEVAALPYSYTAGS